MAAAFPGNIRDFSFASIAENGTKIFASRAKLFLGVSLLIHCPAVLFGFLFPTPTMGPEGLTASDGLSLGGGIVLSLVLQSILSAIVMFIVVMEAQGRTVTLTQAFAAGFNRSITAVLTSFALIGFVFLGSLLIVPGIVFLAWFFVAVQVSVAERRWPLQSLSRSRDLTKNHRWSILGLNAVYVLVAVLLSQLAASAVSGLLLSPSAALALTVLATTAADALSTVVFAVWQSVGYLVLVKEKDGDPSGPIARVFD